MRRLLTCLLLTLPLAAEPVDGARLLRRSATGGLAPALRGTTGWVGWSAPSFGDRAMCCWDSFESLQAGRGGSCRLDRGHGMNISDGDGAAALAGREMRVFARLEAGAARDVQVFSAGCRVDAGGADVTWFDGVAPEQSITVLAAWAAHDETALAAIAMHDHPAAVETLLRTARGHADADTRGHALFWVSQRAGDQAAAAIEHALAADPEQAVKEKAVFALSQLPRDEGVPLLLRTMQTNRNPEVRRQAAFWLGQSKDPRALAYFEELLR